MKKEVKETVMDYISNSIDANLGDWLNVINNYTWYGFNKKLINCTGISATEAFAGKALTFNITSDTDIPFNTIYHIGSNCVSENVSINTQGQIIILEHIKENDDESIRKTFLYCLDGFIDTYIEIEYGIKVKYEFTTNSKGLITSVSYDGDTKSYDNLSEQELEKQTKELNQAMMLDSLATYFIFKDTPY